jgi:hypothetical protein
MSKSDVLENSLLLLLFNAVPIIGLASDDPSVPVFAFTVALHTADPGEDGTQTTNEISYSGYVRVVVPRSAEGWTVTDNVVTPTAAIEFPTMLGGDGGLVTHFSIGTDDVEDTILFSGPVTPNLTVATSVTPQLSTTTHITED